jgi:PAS domain S-box-containing protein
MIESTSSIGQGSRPPEPSVGNRVPSSIRGTAEYFRALLEHANDAMFTLENGRFVDCNERAAEMFGYSEAELVGLKPADISPELQPDGGSSGAKSTEYNAAALRGEPQFFQWLHRRKDGALFHVEVSLNRIAVAGEVFLHAVVRDITERRAAQDALQRRMAFEHLIADVSTRLLACALSEVDTEIEAALGRVGEMAQVDRVYVFLARESDDSIDNTHEWCAPGIVAQREHLQGLHRSDFPWATRRLEAGDKILIQNVADLPEEMSAERQLMEGQGVRAALILPMARGSRSVGFLGFDAVRSTREWDGGDIAVLETLANIFVSSLERVRGRQKVAERDTRLELALRGADLTMWDVDLKTGEIHFDERWAGMLGYNSDEMPRDMKEWSRFIHPEDVGSMSDGMKGNANFARPFVGGDFRMKTGAGDWRWLKARGRVVIREPDGSPLRAAGTILDIDDQKRAEEELERLTEQLHQAQKMELIGQLAGAVAHDFNNLLVPILTYADFLVDNPGLDDSAREDALQIAEAARRAAALTKQLLATSRRQMMRIEAVDLDDVVRDSEKLLRRLLPENITWDAVFGTGGAKVPADPGQLQQILMNLVVNAADAMPEGGKLIVVTGVTDVTAEQARKSPAARMGRFATIVVSDTGAGIPAQHRERIFEPFFTTKEKGKGTGLGLSTVDGIARQHEGFVEVESAPGLGTTFRVHLPIDRRVAIMPSSTPPAAPAVAVAARILVVEDDVQVRLTAARILRSNGHTVIEAPDAETAVSLVRAGGEIPDLLLTDVVLPGMNGTKLYKQLVAGVPGLKVCFMSGYPGHEEETMTSIGAHTFIAKPFTRESLSHAIGQALAECLEEQ